MRNALTVITHILFMFGIATQTLAEQVPKAGTIFQDCPDCPEMAVIPAGSFDMGGVSETPVHHVIIIKAFAISKTEVTQSQWQGIMGNNPSTLKSYDGNYPVESVSWDDAQEFVKKLSAKTGKHYRLPSEAEWEYACRAGQKYKYCGSDNVDSVAWYGGKTTHPIATKQPNAFGLYDMSGNVSEWVEENSLHYDYKGAPNDGRVWRGGDRDGRIIRGGAWDDPLAMSISASARLGVIPDNRVPDIGFRLARTLP